MPYRIRNWKAFQHYRHRSPPWIKLHFQLLTSNDWVVLDDASRVLAVACMLLASRSKEQEGQIPDDLQYLKNAAYLHTYPQLKPLIDCGFLEEFTPMLASCKQLRTNADPEESKSKRRVETEKRTLAPKENGAWWKSEPGIEAKGKELGLPPNRGESWNDYKDRLFAVINLQKA